MASVESTSVSKTTGLFAIPDPLKELLGYSAIAYALGFLTVTLNTARYGVIILELTRPLNLWVGAIPTFALAVAFTLWRRHKGNVKETTISLVAMIIPLIVLIPIASLLAYGFQWALLHLLSRTGNIGPEWQRAHLFGISVAIGTVLVLVSIWTIPFTEPDEWAAQNRLFTCVTLIFIVGYVFWLYPRLPEQYGFGKPASVVLILKREAVTDGMGILAPGTGKKGIVITRSNTIRPIHLISFISSTERHVS